MRPAARPGNAGVDLIVDDRRQRVAVRQRALERQHKAGKLTAGRDLCQRLRLLAGVRRNQKFHGILPVGGQRPPRMLERKADARHVQKFQRRLHLLVHGSKAFQAALGQLLGSLLGGGIQRLGICAFSSAIFCPDDWKVSSSAAAASRRASSSSTSMPNFCLMR